MLLSSANAEASSIISDVTDSAGMHLADGSDGSDDGLGGIVDGGGCVVGEAEDGDDGGGVDGGGGEDGLGEDGGGESGEGPGEIGPMDWSLLIKSDVSKETGPRGGKRLEGMPAKKLCNSEEDKSRSRLGDDVVGELLLVLLGDGASVVLELELDDVEPPTLDAGGP